MPYYGLLSTSSSDVLLGESVFVDLVLVRVLESLSEGSLLAYILWFLIILLCVLCCVFIVSVTVEERVDALPERLVRFAMVLVFIGNRSSGHRLP